MTAALSMPALAGGLLHNTNQSIHFMRMMARGATTEVDAIYSNPAGTAFNSHDGWQVSVNIQSATQRRDIDATFSLFPEADHKRFYKGEAVAPVVPSLYGMYRKGKWAFSGFFGIVGGGGKCNFNNGLPMFDAAAMALIYNQSQQLLGMAITPDKYSISSSMRGRQYVFGLQLGAAYRFNDHWSAFVGGRMNYFSGNYRGHVDVTAGSDLVALGRQLAQARPELAPTLNAMMGEGGLGHVALDCDQSGWGVTPILGVNYHWDRLTLAAKYEFKTHLNIENDTKKLECSSEQMRERMAEYEHGVNTPNDLPAVLYVAAGFEFIPNKLRGAVEYHFYDDRHARMANDKQKALKHGTHEILAGLEWDINRLFTVSGGFQNTDYGLSDDYQSHTSFSCDSYTLGFGGKVNITPKLALNVAYFWTTYRDYTKVVPAGNPGYCGTTLAGTDVYSRTNKVFGVGVDYKF